MAKAVTTLPSEGVSVPQRIVPFPTSISAPARAALQRLVTAQGLPVNALQPLPPLADKAAWQALKDQVNDHYALAVKGMASHPRASVDTLILGETEIHVATPEGSAHPQRACIDLHGGALLFGGGEACRVGAQQQADRYGVRCFGVDYRLPPDFPYPAALDDCLAAYRHVLSQYSPADIVLIGRSAGGNLALATLLRGRDEGLPMPAGLVLLSPQADLTESGDSFAVNALVDVVLPGSLAATNLLYANGADLHDPLVSPLFGDLSGFPPTLLQSGTRDLFLSTTVRLHRALRRAGVAAELHVFEAMPHGGFGGGTPEDAELLAEVAAFVAGRWGGSVV